MPVVLIQMKMIEKIIQGCSFLNELCNDTFIPLTLLLMVQAQKTVIYNRQLW